MNIKYYKVLFMLFLLSGFCSLLYQVVWMRMAYAFFGVITPVMSVVISVFMLGLSIGSWAGGRWISGLCKKTKVTAIFFYGAAEVIIGLGAFFVPQLFSYGSDLLLAFGEMDSIGYLFYSALTICFSILPWCVFMGFTFPFMMAFVKEIDDENTTAFSYLYFANVIGAMLGTLVTAIVLIELAGFRNTLLIAAGVNFFIAVISIIIGIRHPYISFDKTTCKDESLDVKPLTTQTNVSVPACLVLFTTGLISMAMEVVWIRGFTPVLQTRTYSFAALLSVYLFATWVGSYLYRKHLEKQNIVSTQKLLSGLAVFSLLPVVMNDPRLQTGMPSALISIIPFCAVLGYLTPKLIDQYSSGTPSNAGKAYAYNILGCIIGPIFASYILLPAVGVKISILILSAPVLLFILVYYKETVFSKDWSVILTSLALCVFTYAGFVNVSYEEMYASYKGSVVKRDHTATVVSLGEGLNKLLLVNGIGITKLTTVTKNMAHLPLAFCEDKPESALVICFGMGTTYRSLLSWNIGVTAIELVPSVKEVFGYYHKDAEIVLNNPRGRVIIDDGRRFLKRTFKSFDVITIDPPPPVEAAGSSLLYSEDFYALVKKRLKKNGILHQWFPGGELKILNAMARSLSNEFPYIKVYKSIEGWGIHFICSSTPLDALSAKKMVSKMPDSAQKDLLEWFRSKDMEKAAGVILSQKVTFSDLLVDDKDVTITDDRPYNEYYILRRQYARLIE